MNRREMRLQCVGISFVKHRKPTAGGVFPRISVMRTDNGGREGARSEAIPSEGVWTSCPSRLAGAVLPRRHAGVCPSPPCNRFL